MDARSSECFINLSQCISALFILFIMGVNTMAQKQYIVFSLSGQKYAIDIARIVQIINPSEIYKVPDTPDYVEGLINLRGTVYTIFNLKKKLAISNSIQEPVPESLHEDTTKIIILSTESANVGLIVDEVNEITAFSDEDYTNDKELAPDCETKYISDIIKKDDKVVFILNLEQIISK